MLGVDGIDDVHHLHLWNLASDVPALSAHIVLAGEPTLRLAQLATDQVRATLDHRFATANVTPEPECSDPLNMSASEHPPAPDDESAVFSS
jgi:cobalt-zinc-cadmium efflux system protein